MVVKTSKDIKSKEQAKNKELDIRLAKLRKYNRLNKKEPWIEHIRMVRSICGKKKIPVQQLKESFIVLDQLARELGYGQTELSETMEAMAEIIINRINRNEKEVLAGAKGGLEAAIERISKYLRFNSQKNKRANTYCVIALAYLVQEELLIKTTAARMAEKVLESNYIDDALYEPNKEFIEEFVGKRFDEPKEVTPTREEKPEIKFTTLSAIITVIEKIKTGEGIIEKIDKTWRTVFSEDKKRIEKAVITGIEELWENAEAKDRKIIEEFAEERKGKFGRQLMVVVNKGEKERLKKLKEICSILEKNKKTFKKLFGSFIVNENISYSVVMGLIAGYTEEEIIDLEIAAGQDEVKRAVEFLRGPVSLEALSQIILEMKDWIKLVKIIDFISRLNSHELNMLRVFLCYHMVPDIDADIIASQLNIEESEVNRILLYGNIVGVIERKEKRKVVLTELGHKWVECFINGKMYHEILIDDQSYPSLEKSLNWTKLSKEYNEYRWSNLPDEVENFLIQTVQCLKENEDGLISIINNSVLDEEEYNDKFDYAKSRFEGCGFSQKDAGKMGSALLNNKVYLSMMEQAKRGEIEIKTVQETISKTFSFIVLMLDNFYRLGIEERDFPAAFQAIVLEGVGVEDLKEYIKAQKEVSLPLRKKNIYFVGGTGDIAEDFALMFAKKHNVYVGSRKKDEGIDKAKELEEKLRSAEIEIEGIVGEENGEMLRMASKEGGIVILAVPVEYIESTIDQYKEELNNPNLIIISLGNNMKAREDKVLEVVKTGELNVAEMIKEALPRARVVAAFNNYKAHLLKGDPKNKVSMEIGVASDDRQAKRIIMDLINTGMPGLIPFNAGGLDDTGLLEEITAAAVNSKDEMLKEWKMEEALKVVRYYQDNLDYFKEEVRKITGKEGDIGLQDLLALLFDKDKREFMQETPDFVKNAPLEIRQPIERVFKQRKSKPDVVNKVSSLLLLPILTAGLFMFLPGVMTVAEAATGVVVDPGAGALPFIMSLSMITMVVGISTFFKKAKKKEKIFLENKIYFNQDINLRPAIIEKIKKVISWELKPDLAPSGRTGLIILDKPIIVNKVKITAIKIKGLGDYFTDPENPTPPTTKEFHDSGQPDFYTEFDENGEFYIKETIPKPLGGNIYKEAREEYKFHLNAFKKGDFVSVPLAYGEYPEIKYKGETLGFVILGITDPRDRRVDNLFAGDLVSMDKKTAQVVISDYLRELLGGKKMEDFFEKLFEQWGHTLRRFHNAGFIHRNPHGANFSYEKNKIKIHDLESSKRKQDLKNEQVFMYQLYEVGEVLSRIYLLINTLIGLDIYQKGKINVYHSFLKGYFKEELLRNKADIRIEMKKASQGLMEEFPPVQTKKLPGETLQIILNSIIHLYVPFANVLEKEKIKRPYSKEALKEKVVNHFKNIVSFSEQLRKEKKTSILPGRISKLFSIFLALIGVNTIALLIGIISKAEATTEVTTATVSIVGIPGMSIIMLSLVAAGLSLIALRWIIKALGERASPIIADKLTYILAKVNPLIILMVIPEKFKIDKLSKSDEDQYISVASTELKTISEGNIHSSVATSEDINMVLKMRYEDKDISNSFANYVKFQKQLTGCPFIVPYITGSDGIFRIDGVKVSVKEYVIEKKLIIFGNELRRDIISGNIEGAKDRLNAWIKLHNNIIERGFIDKIFVDFSNKRKFWENLGYDENNILMYHDIADLDKFEEVDIGIANKCIDNIVESFEYFFEDIEVDDNIRKELTDYFKDRMDTFTYGRKKENKVSIIDNSGKEIEINYILEKAKDVDSKQTLLFIPGLGGSLEYWDYIKEHYKNEGYNVLLIDIKGMGESVLKGYDYKDEYFTMESFADDINKVIGKLRLDEQEITIAGHSIGGEIGMEFAVKYGKDSTKLITIGTTIKKEAEGSVKEVRFLNRIVSLSSPLIRSGFFLSRIPLVGPVVKGIGTILGSIVFMSFLGDFFVRKNMLSAKKINIVMKAFLSADIKAVNRICNYMEEDHENHYKELLRRIKAKGIYVAAIAGALGIEDYPKEEHYTTEEIEARKIAEAAGYPGNVKIIKGVKHGGMLEKPEEFIIALDKILHIKSESIKEERLSFGTALGYNLKTLMQVVLNVTDVVLNPINTINMFLGEKKEGKREFEVKVLKYIREIMIKNIPPEFLEQVERDKVQVRGTTREDLVSMKEMWAMAGLAEHPDKKDTLVLYIHQKYLKVLKALAGKKRKEMFAALARHEVWEYQLVNIYGIPQEIAHLIITSNNNANEWNKALEQAGMEELGKEAVGERIKKIVRANNIPIILMFKIKKDVKKQQELERIAKDIISVSLKQKDAQDISAENILENKKNLVKQLFNSMRGDIKDWKKILFFVNNIKEEEELEILYSLFYLYTASNGDRGNVLSYLENALKVKKDKIKDLLNYLSKNKIIKSKIKRTINLTDYTREMLKGFLQGDEQKTSKFKDLLDSYKLGETILKPKGIYISLTLTNLENIREYNPSEITERIIKQMHGEKATMMFSDYRREVKEAIQKYAKEKLIELGFYEAAVEEIIYALTVPAIENITDDLNIIRQYKDNPSLFDDNAVGLKQIGDIVSFLYVEKKKIDDYLNRSERYRNYDRDLKKVLFPEFQLALAYLSADEIIDKLEKEGPGAVVDFVASRYTLDRLSDDAIALIEKIASLSLNVKSFGRIKHRKGEVGIDEEFIKERQRITDEKGIFGRNVWKEKSAKELDKFLEQCGFSEEYRKGLVPLLVDDKLYKDIGISSREKRNKISREMLMFFDWLTYSINLQKYGEDFVIAFQKIVLEGLKPEEVKKQISGEKQQVSIEVSEKVLDRFIKERMSKVEPIIIEIRSVRPKAKMKKLKLSTKEKTIIGNLITKNLVDEKMGFDNEQIAAVIAKVSMFHIYMKPVKDMIKKKNLTNSAQLEEIPEEIKDIVYYFLVENKKLKEAGYEEFELELYQLALLKFSADEIIEKVKSGQEGEIKKQVFIKLFDLNKNLISVGTQILIRDIAKLLEEGKPQKEVVDSKIIDKLTGYGFSETNAKKITSAWLVALGNKNVNENQIFEFFELFYERCVSLEIEGEDVLKVFQIMVLGNDSKYYFKEFPCSKKESLSSMLGYNVETLLKAVLMVTDAVLNPINTINMFLGEKKEGEREYEFEVPEDIRKTITDNIPPGFKFKTDILKQKEVSIKKIMDAFENNGAMLVTTEKDHPYTMYHWIRDSSLVIEEIIQLYKETEDPQLKDRLRKIIEKFIEFTKINQQTESEYYLGETRFLAEDGEAEDSASQWGRPQNDGSALRAAALIDYANLLIEQGNIDEALNLYNDVIKKDLDYVAEHWENRCFDLWEDLMGFHFWTRKSQIRALNKGLVLADNLKVDTAEMWKQALDSLEDEIVEHCDDSEGYIRSTLERERDIEGKKPGKGFDSDIDTSVVGSIVKDSDLKNPIMPVDDSWVMKTVIEMEKVFGTLYPINKKWIEEGNFGRGIGRYPEDAYYGGNPWFINTAWFSQYYSLLALKFLEQGKISITSDNISFFRNIGIDVLSAKTVTKDDKLFNEIIDNLSSNSQGYLKWIIHYIPKTGLM
ncbi:alpha/beta fold hydrolase, partial [bacterium]|nr:alpha/beta fold hydrolase [bacterium]